MHAAFNKVLFRMAQEAQSIKYPPTCWAGSQQHFWEELCSCKRFFYLAFSLLFFGWLLEGIKFWSWHHIGWVFKNWLKPKYFFSDLSNGQKRSIWALGKKFAQIILRRIEYCGLKISSNLVRLSLRVPSTTGTPSSPSIFSEVPSALFKVDKSFLVSGAVAWMVGVL